METLQSIAAWFSVHVTARNLAIFAACYLLGKVCEIIFDWLSFRYTPAQFEELKKDRPLLAAIVIAVKGGAFDGVKFSKGINAAADILQSKEDEKK